MDLVHEEEARIDAPASLVWEEVGSLEQLLANAPETYELSSSADGEHASVKVKMRWGPVTWNLDSEVALTEVRPGEHLVFTSDVARLKLHVVGTVDLKALPSGRTGLTYQAEATCGHVVASRLRSSLRESLEEHVRSIVARVAQRAEQRHLANERLLGPRPHGRSR